MTSLPEVHDIFRVLLKNFVQDFKKIASKAIENEGANPTAWMWWEQGEYGDFLTNLYLDSMNQSHHLLYTRDNYVKFSKMMYHVTVNLPHLLVFIPQWSFLLTEIHCVVLEREAFTSKDVRVVLAQDEPDKVFNASRVNGQLRSMLCRLEAR
jgi:hypothetical protein